MGIKHAVNEEFFLIWKSSMAYVLGYLYADGNVQNSPYMRGKYVQVTSVDLSSIKMIRRALESKHKITEDKKRTGYSRRVKYRLKIGSHILYDSLSSRGLYPNKSLTARLPEIPNNFFGDFLRGYFDGDGCVFLEKEKDNKKKVKRMSIIFTSGSKNFLVDLEKKIREITEIKEKNIYKSHRSFQLRYSTKDSTRLFFIMYPDGEMLYMKRKYSIFLKYFMNHKIGHVVK